MGKTALILIPLLFLSKLSISQQKEDEGMDTISNSLKMVKITIENLFEIKNKEIQNLKKTNDILKNQLDSVISLLNENNQKSEKQKIKKSDKLEKIFGEDILQIIQNSFEINAYIINSKNKDDSLPNREGLIEGYEISVKKISVNPKIELKLKNLFLNENIYKHNGFEKKCIFFPYIAFQFKTKTGTVDILNCFSCDEFEFYLNGVRKTKENSSGFRSDLLKLSRQIFFGDNILKSLK